MWRATSSACSTSSRPWGSWRPSVVSRYFDGSSWAPRRAWRPPPTSTYARYAFGRRRPPDTTMHPTSCRRTSDSRHYPGAMEQVWASRLRWRLRGAWQWPMFAALAVVDAVLLHELPVAGDSGPRLIGALLLAGVLNLVAVAVAGPLGGLLLRRRRPDLPGVVASDYAGTAAMLAVTALLLVIGLVHRPNAQADREALSVGLSRVRAYVGHNAP